MSLIPLQILGNPISYSESKNILSTIIAQPELALTLSQEEIYIPASIIRNNSSLEAIVTYLKDIKGYTFAEISRLLNRDQRTIWNVYNDGKNKDILFSQDQFIGPTIPLIIFKSRTLSILESVVFYFRSNTTLSFKDISNLLGKNYRTIYTVHKRALEKLTNE